MNARHSWFRHLVFLFFTALVGGPKAWAMAGESPYLSSYREFWIRKEINLILKRHRPADRTPSSEKDISPALRRKVELLWEWRRQDSEREWWSYSPDSQQCFNTQIELKEYLNFLRDENHSFTLKEDRKRQFFAVKINLKDRQEISYWSKRRTTCELNKAHYGTLNLSPGQSINPKGHQSKGNT